MISVSAGFRTAATNSHEAKFRVELRKTTGELVEVLTDSLIGGAVTIDSSASYRRQLSLTLSQEVLGWAGGGGGSLGTGGRYGDMSAKYGSKGQTLSYGQLAGGSGGTIHPQAGHEIHVWRGIVVSGSTEWVKLGVFHISSVRSVAKPGNTIEVTGYDRSRLVSLTTWLTTTEAPGIIPLHLLINASVKTLLGSIPFNTKGTIASPTPDRGAYVLELGSDPWEELSKVAKSYGLEMFFDANGDFVVQYLPLLTGPSDWTFRAGSNGTLIDRDLDQTDEGVCNAVLVMNSEGMLAYAADGDAGSTTYVYGPFGQRVHIENTDLQLNETQAMALAQKLLSQKLGLMQELNITSVPMPALEPGDIVRVFDSAGIDSQYNVVAVTIPLDLVTPMTTLVRREIA
jgi:hypothetical protein